HKITGKNQEYKWGSEQQTAFEELKKEMLKEVVLEHPDWDKPFILYTDASGGGLGAVLSQINENGEERPIAFASKALQNAQHNYAATELELLAVMWAVTEKFEQYLLGKEFVIVSDHQALRQIVKNSTESKRMKRWLTKLQEYNFEVVYKPGNELTNADALSGMTPSPVQGLEHPIIGAQSPKHKLKRD